MLGVAAFAAGVMLKLHASRHVVTHSSYSHTKPTLWASGRLRWVRWLIGVGLEHDILLMTHFETTTARRCNSGSGCGNHGGSGGVEGGRSGSDGGGKDGWQRGGGTWQQEQRFGQCSGAHGAVGE